jgi:hypothetical protein
MVEPREVNEQADCHESGGNNQGDHQWAFQIEFFGKLDWTICLERQVEIECQD